MVFLFISLACFALFAAIFAATFAIDHFATTWETADPGSWRGRFSSWAANSTNLDIVKGLSGLASALACLAFFVAIFYVLMFVGFGERRFPVYTTGGSATAGAATPREFYATKGDLNRTPVFEYVDSHRIVTGRVSSILPIGGGLTHICVGNGDYCGLADSSLELKPGDIAYIRIGRPPTGQRRPPGWTITADEAKSLAAKAQFTIENR
ncbi:MAG: hypothetical protein ABSH40_11370 [Bryobacteraceae bacterium]|jgi:hypothetical protein